MSCLKYHIIVFPQSNIILELGRQNQLNCPLTSATDTQSCLLSGNDHTTTRKNQNIVNIDFIHDKIIPMCKPVLFILTTLFVESLDAPGTINTRFHVEIILTNFIH